MRMLLLAIPVLLLFACSDKDEDDDGGRDDTATTDGGSTDGGATDGGSTDGGSTDGGSTDGGSTDGGATDECAEVPPESCDETPGCTGLWAWPVRPTETGWCADFGAERETLGCMSADMGCGSAETPATTGDRPEECLWLFPSTCLPHGFVACPEGALPECG